MLSEVEKNSVTAKDLDKFLARAYISVDKSNIRKKLVRVWSLQKEHLDIRRHYWQNNLWTDETQVELMKQKYNIMYGE